ncbi:MAG: hypothetical protein NVS9B11_12620 [Candidatus Dormibacteraceae bacterium]
MRKHPAEPMPENARYTTALREVASAADAAGVSRMKSSISLAGWGGFGTTLFGAAHDWNPIWVVVLLLVTALALSFGLPMTSKAGKSMGDLLSRVIETKGPSWFGLAPAEAPEPVTKSQKKAAPTTKSGNAKQSKSRATKSER